MRTGFACEIPFGKFLRDFALTGNRNLKLNRPQDPDLTLISLYFYSIILITLILLINIPDGPGYEYYDYE